MHMSAILRQGSKLERFQVMFRTVLSCSKHFVYRSWGARNDWNVLIASLIRV